MQFATLTGRGIELRLLRESDAEALAKAAADGQLWNLPFTIIPSPEKMNAYISEALEDLATGTIFPYVTQIKETQQVIGTTRYMNLSARNRKLEIGGTWLAASWQRTFVNTEAKLLMLRYAFENLSCVRVQFCINETNIKSRAAVLRLGAKQEGILRSERIMPDGSRRNSVFYSILEDEWPGVKQTLEQKLNGSRPC